VRSFVAVGALPSVAFGVWGGLSPVGAAAGAFAYAQFFFVFGAAGTYVHVFGQTQGLPLRTCYSFNKLRSFSWAFKLVGVLIDMMMSSFSNSVR